MNTTSPETEILPSGSNGANKPNAPDEKNHNVHRFQPGLGDHPLWQALMDEMEKNRQADIAEANRLADLERE